MDERGEQPMDDAPAAVTDAAGSDTDASADIASRPRTDLDIPGETVAGGPTGTEDFDAFAGGDPAAGGGDGGR